VTPADAPATCSARGCSAPARWSLLWNNPRLHTAERRKVWLACDDHRESLGKFLATRSFLRDVEPFDAG
jgi:hypothetical protein